MQKPGFVHNVYFWVHHSITDAERIAFHEGVQKLARCKTVLNGFMGPPAGTLRDVVDNTYDYALVLFFRNKKDHDTYQEDPDHHAFIDQFKHLWQRVQVYDHLPV